MKKIGFIVLALVFSSALCVYAQSGDTAGNTSITDPDASNIGNDSARQALREVSVDRFEREGFWNVHISPDYGVIWSPF